MPVPLFMVGTPGETIVEGVIDGYKQSALHVIEQPEPYMKPSFMFALKSAFVNPF